MSSWRRCAARPAPLIGTFVALAMAALLVTATAIFIGTGITLSAPAQRLAGTTPVVTGNPDVRVTSGAGDNVETDVLPLPDYRRVPLGLANGLASVDGVAGRRSACNAGIPGGSPWPPR